MAYLFLSILITWNAFGLCMLIFLNVKNEVKNEWNLHTIRYTKGCQVSGIPNPLYYLPEWKGYALQGHQLSEADIVNVLQQNNFEEELEQIMEGTSSRLQEYFRYIASSQKVNHPPSDWDNEI